MRGHPRGTDDAPGGRGLSPGRRPQFFVLPGPSRSWENSQGGSPARVARPGGEAGAGGGQARIPHRTPASSPRQSPQAAVKARKAPGRRPLLGHTCRRPVFSGRSRVPGARRPDWPGGARSAGPPAGPSHCLSPSSGRGVIVFTSGPRFWDFGLGDGTRLAAMRDLGGPGSGELVP